AAPGDMRQSRLIEVSWRMPGSPDPRGEAGAMDAMQADARAHGRVQPFRALLQTIADLDCYIQLFPLDADFPNLARLSNPVAVTRMLQEAQLGYTGSASYEVTPVRYRPGQRHVLRYDPLDFSGAIVPRSALFAKLYNNDKGARTVAVATNVSAWLAEQNRGINAVRPSGYVEPLNLALYPYVDGIPLTEFLRDDGPVAAEHLHAAGRALEALHRIPESLVELRPHSFAGELKSIVSASEHIAPLLPATGEQIQALLARAQALHESLPEEQAGFAYGDFKADHLWVTERGMTLIDFDTCYRCDPAIDLGKFLADIQWWYDVYGHPSVDPAQTHFLEGYGPCSAVRRQRARLYEALVLMKSTVRRVKLFDADWAPRTARLIGRAAQVLERLAAGDSH
ncbi:MAG TPA: aminoglycoside phosphotransferase family protein, partial [Roseiflexaceae bacterium]|nr:aminoglycoside phosphotransferase family protein [Roseiflexaceae bacterium]